MTTHLNKYVTRNNIGIIKSDTYAKSYEYIQQLVSAAKADFPGLQDNEIQIVLYGGDRWARQLGIEFRITGEAPSDYKEIGMPEMVLAGGI